MGLVYYPKQPMEPHCPSQYEDDGAWDVNAWGADLLGTVHAALDIPVYDIGGSPYRVPYSATAAESEAMAKQLAEVSDTQIQEVFESHDLSRGFDGSVEDFIEWIRDWQKFLEKCKGYECS